MNRRLLGRLSWLCLLTLTAILPRVIWSRTEDTVRTPQWVALWILGWTAWAAGVAAGRSPAWAGSPLRAPLAASALAALLLPLAAFRPSAAAADSLGVLAGLGAAAAAAWWLGNPVRLRKAGLAVIVAHLIVSFDAGKQYFGLERTRWAFQFGGERPFATLGNPNFLAGEMVTVLAWAAGLFLSATAPAGRLGWLAAAGLWGAIVLVAQTRGTWIAAGVALAWLGWRWRAEAPAELARARGWLLAVAVAGIAAGGLAIIRNPALAERVSSLSHPDFGQIAKRAAAWRVAFLAWRDRPLTGFGPGCFNHAHGKHLARAIPAGEEKQFIHVYSEAYPHWDLLQMLAEAGVAGTGVFLWLLAAVWRALRRMADRRLGRALEAGGVAFLAHGTFNLPLHIAPTMFLLYLGIGLAARGGAAGFVADRTAALRLGIPAAACLIAGTLAGVTFAASLYTRLGKDTMGRQMWHDADRWFMKGLHLDWEDRREAFYAASMRFQSGSPRESVPLFEEEIRRNPYFMDGHANLGAVLGSLKDLAGAERNLKRALELHPAYAEAYANLGVANLEARRYREAAEYFLSALALDPANPLAASGLAQAKAKFTGGARLP